MGLFGGGGSKEGEVPSPEDYYTQAKEYYANYSQWTKDATDRYERDLSMNQARYSAGGGRGDNAYLKTLNDARTKTYQEEMKDLEGGEHGKFLTAYFNDAKQSMKGQLGDFAAPNAMTAKGAFRNRGGSELGTQNYFKPSQEARDARETTDNAQTQMSRFTSKSAAPGSAPGARQDWASVGASGGIGGVGPQGMIDQGANTVAAQQGIFAAENARIDAITMDEMFGKEFGAAKSTSSLEDKAVERARSGASGRKTGGAGEEARSAWWG